MPNDIFKLLPNYDNPFYERWMKILTEEPTFYFSFFPLLNIWAQYQDDGRVAQHRIEIRVEEVSTLLDGRGPVREVIGEEVVRRGLACINQRVPPIARAFRESDDDGLMVGIEGHIDLSLHFISLLKRRYIIV